MRFARRFASALTSLVATALTWYGLSGCSAADALDVDVPGVDSPAGEIGETTQALCPEGPAFPSCAGHCGFLVCSPAFPEICCACDAGCVARDDCCCDKETACAIPNDSCAGRCGDGVPAPAGCFCDDLCMGFGDCCGDFQPLCWGWPIVYGTSGVDQAPAVAVDAARNVYLTAQLSAPYDFGAGSVPVDGPSDVAVTRFDNLANAEWSKRLAFESGTLAQAAALDSAGRLHVVAANGAASPPTGMIQQLNQETGTVFWTASRIGKGFYDVVAKAGGGVLVSGAHLTPLLLGSHRAGLLDFTASGTVTPRASTDVGLIYRRVALDSAGNSYVPVLGTGFVGSTTVASRIESLGPTGARRWSRQIMSLDVRDVAVDGSASYFVGTCGAGCFATPVGPSLGAVIFSHALDAGGTQRFSRELLATGANAELVRVVLGPSNVLHVLGRTFGVLSLGSGSVGTAGRTTLFVLRFNSVGGLLSSAVVARTTTSTATLLPRDLAVAPNGSVFVSGEHSGQVEISGALYSTSGDANAFVARL